MKHMSDGEMAASIQERKRLISAKASPRGAAAAVETPLPDTAKGNDEEARSRSYTPAGGAEAGTKEEPENTEIQHEGGDLVLEISCSNLPEHANHSDPIAVVYSRDGPDSSFNVVSKTEKVPHQHNPIFQVGSAFLKFLTTPETFPPKFCRNP